jgi:hypothetical protein
MGVSSSLRFTVDGVLFAEPAIFLQLQPIRRVLLVLHLVVVALLAFGAGKGDFDSHSGCLLNNSGVIQTSLTAMIALACAHEKNARKKEPPPEV